MHRKSVVILFSLIIAVSISIFAYAQLVDPGLQGGQYNASAGNTQGVNQIFELNAGESQDFSFNVNGGTELNGDLALQGSATLSLINPASVEINKANASSFGTKIEDITVPSGGEGLIIPGLHTRFTVLNPIQGSWTIRVRADSKIQCWLIASTSGNGALDAYTSLNSLTREYSIGDTAFIGGGIVVSQPGEATNPPQLKGLTVSGIITSTPARTYLPLVFNDDGVGSDKVANDGAYNAPLPTDAVGNYQVVVTYKESSGKVLGTAAENYSVVSQLGKINSVQDIGATDTNGDGLTDYFTLNVNLTAVQSGRHDVVIFLRASNGKEFQVSGQQQIATGPATIPVQVFVSDIRQALGVDGPYAIRLVGANYVPADSASPSKSLGKLENAGQTQPYALNSFQRPKISVLGLVLDQAIDTNADGFFDQLNLSTSVNVINTGLFIWTASLKDAQGNVIDNAQNSGTLNAGDNTLSFPFNGDIVGLTGVNGPYTLGDITIYPSNGGDGLVSDLSFPTQAYRSSQFNGGVIRGKFSGVLKGSVTVKTGKLPAVVLPLKSATLLLDITEQAGVLTGTAAVGPELAAVTGKNFYTFTGTRSGSTILFNLPYRTGGSFPLEAYLALGKNIELPATSKTIVSGSSSVTITFARQIFSPVP